MKIYLDDEREAPEGYTRMYNAEQVIAGLQYLNVEVLSLDHDLGENVPTGYTVLLWLEEKVFNDPTFPIPEITIHSANPAGRANMMRAIDSIKRIRQAQAQE